MEPIDPNKTYPFELIPGLLGISIEAIRDAEDAGMKCPKFGCKKYVRGKVLADWIDANG